MSDTYTKLFSSITASTIVSEPVATRWAWVTMLAAVKPDGCVYGSVPGLARLANLSVEEIEAAIACFLAPDPYSRTKDHEGRRIEVIDGGWRLLNHGKYDNVRSEAERAEYKRQWDREHRPSGHARQKSDSSPTVRQQSDKSDSSPKKPDSPTPSTSTSTSTRSKAIERQAARFDEFWAIYPVKKGRAEAEAKWKAKGYDAIADRIISDVKARLTGDRQWLDGYAQHGSTYVNQRVWEDAIEPPVSRQGSAQADLPDFMRGAI